MSDQERVAFSCCLLCALPSLTHVLNGVQKKTWSSMQRKIPFFSSVWLPCVHVQQVLACKTWFCRISGLCRRGTKTISISTNGRSPGDGPERGQGVVWSSPAWHYCKLPLCGLQRKRWLLSSLFLLVVQLFTISWGMESGLVWLLHTCCCLKHSFSETNDFDVVVNELLMSVLPLVWFMCFTAASS